MSAAAELMARLDDSKDSMLDTSLGSDGERSGSSFSDLSSPPVTPTDPDKASLKFGIDNILRPEFGKITETKPPKSPQTNRTGSASVPATPFDLSTTRKLFAMGQTTASATSSTPSLWPAWVYCTRYSDRPSSGPRCRRVKRTKSSSVPQPDEKRPRTAFTSDQLNRLKSEFQENRYLTEKRRHELAHELGLNESQIKIWFQNKRAKIKKQHQGRNTLALHLMAQGLYNHSTIPVVDGSEC